MEKTTLTFLGTSNAIPTPSRNHTAILLSYKNENILIDCGEGTQRQFRLAKISPTKITRILITHWHGDHILGLPGLLQTLAMSNYSRVLQIYGPKKTKRFISLIEELISRFKIKIEVHELSPPLEKPIIETLDFEIEALPMQHKVPALAYAFKIKDQFHLSKQKLKQFKLPSSPLLKTLKSGSPIKHQGKTIRPEQVSFLVPSKKITFILDTKANPNAEKIAKNSDLLISEASFTEKESSLAEEKEHLTAKQAATIASRSQSKSLILTHISQRYEHSPELILKEAKAVFPNTKIAKDLDVVEI